MHPEDASPPPADRPDVALQSNLAAVLRKIEAAARRGGRRPEHARLVAVTKSVDTGIIQRLENLGVSDFGENRIQDADRKIQELSGDPTWHLIGHLQANKSRKAVAMFSWIHSIDSEPLLSRVDELAEELGRRPKVLLQVNVSGEATKHGFDEAAVRATVTRFRPRAVTLAGLMTMAPFDAPELARPVFARLRQIRDELRRDGLVNDEFRELSMGMTNDFEVAAEEGATLLRVGRALFDGVTNPSVPPRKEA